MQHCLPVPNILSENCMPVQTWQNNVYQIQNRRDKCNINEEYYLQKSYWVWDAGKWDDDKDGNESNTSDKHLLDMKFWDWSEKEKYNNDNHFKNLENSEIVNEADKNNHEGKANKDDGNFLSRTVEEILNSKELNDALKSGPHYGVSRRRLYHLRQDVIIKIIFRQMRKYYLSDFKSFFDFFKCRSKSNSDTKGVLITQINRYLNMKFKNFCLKNMDIYFLSILNISDKHISISEQNIILRQNISDLLYWFNKSKLVNTLKIPQFAIILLRFLSKNDILRLVLKSQNDVEAIQAYSEEIQMLKCHLRSQLRI